jgi:PAS domain S-box-containing protein
MTAMGSLGQKDTSTTPDCSPAEGASGPDIQAALDTIVSESLRPLTAGLGALFVFYAVGHLLVLPKSVARSMALGASGTALVFFILYLMQRRRPVPPRWAHPIAAAIAGLVLFTNLLFMHAVSEPYQTTNLMLLVIGVGCLFLSARWTVLILAATLLGWAVIAGRAAPSPAWVHFGFALITASALAVIVQTARVRTFRRLQGLRLQDEARRADLEAALATAEEARQAVEASRSDLETAMQATRQSEERFRLLVEGVKDYAIFLLDPGGRVVSWNAGAERIQGYSVQEILGQQFACFYANEDLECGKPGLALRMAAANEWFEDEGWRVRRDGSRFWADVVITTLRDEAGQLRGFSSMTRDITERKRAQEAQQHLTTLLEHEREIVRTLTESFLGRTPLLPGLQVASLYEPAARAERVGGDYFDFIPTHDQRLGVVIGDVCGKGLSAALYTAMAKYTLRAYALEEPDPQKVLSRLNQALYNQISDEEMFVTLVYGVLDLEAGTFTYANAAHPAPVVYDPAASSCQLLGTTGGIVGAVSDWEYEQRSVPLAPGAVLALFTDGVSEAARDREPPDDGGVAAIIQEHAGESVEAIAWAIFAWAHELAGGTLSDDVAIVVIRRD